MGPGYRSRTLASSSVVKERHPSKANERNAIINRNQSVDPNILACCLTHDRRNDEQGMQRNKAGHVSSGK
jgi:hypothetical protein